MSASPNGFDNDPERAKRAGEKSKRKPLDVELQTYFDAYISNKHKEGDERTRVEIMIEAAFIQFLKGNYKPMAFLYERSHGKITDNVKINSESFDLKLTGKELKELYNEIKKDDDC